MRMVASPSGVVRRRSITRARCTECESPLVIHQPDPRLPDRLLGTCEGCKSWHLIDGKRGVMALLPDEEALRNLNPTLRIASISGR